MGDPGGAMGVRLKSKGPCSAVCADILGLVLDARMRLSVRTACGTRRHQRCIGKLSGVEHKPTMKWYLQVWIPRSSALALCT